MQIPKELKDKLQEFNRDAACPKCGNEHIGSRYQRYRTIISNVVAFDIELIKRVCSQCGYMWDELPVEQKNS